MRSYRPEELFDGDGRPAASLGVLRSSGIQRMSALPQANGGELLVPLVLPPIEEHEVDISRPRGHRRGDPRARPPGRPT